MPSVLLSLLKDSQLLQEIVMVDENGNIHA